MKSGLSEEEVMHTLEIGNAYEGVKGLIIQLVSKYVRKYGGVYQEVFSDAFSHFADAWTDYDPRKGAFSNAVYTYVTRGLIGDFRERVFTEDHERTNSSMDTWYSRSSNPSFDLSEFMGNLSEDGRYAADLILNPPLSLLRIVQERLSRSSDNMKRSVKKFLRNQGWNDLRVREAFQNVREFLK
jgi:hypothetical protein